MIDLFSLLLLADQALFKAIYLGLRIDNARIREEFDHVFEVANVLGEFFILVPALVFVAYFSATRSQFVARLVVLALVLIPSTVVLNGLKAGLDRTRPIHVFTEFYHTSHPAWRYSVGPDNTWPGTQRWLDEFMHVKVQLSDVHGPVYATRSFPSGHAQFAFAFATLFGAWFAAARPWLFAWAWATCMARIYGGLHFPLDVVAGALVGWGGTLVALALIHAGAAFGQRKGWRWARWLGQGLPPAVNLSPTPMAQAWGRWLGQVLAATGFVAVFLLGPWLKASDPAALNTLWLAPLAAGIAYGVGRGATPWFAVFARWPNGAVGVVRGLVSPPPSPPPRPSKPASQPRSKPKSK